ncbi:MAG: hypothetical protein Ct9H90mP23_2030 [Methanobacteriota archaeon]|nr:MAG: hypothetical protein Ct9H90mP23_2030 [Euryarchaeota archaeon]
MITLNPPSAALEAFHQGHFLSVDCDLVSGSPNLTLYSLRSEPFIINHKPDIRTPRYGIVDCANDDALD